MVPLSENICHEILDEYLVKAQLEIADGGIRGGAYSCAMGEFSILT